ncbi:MAG TPA: DUF3078 domain-containing protein [Bacteroidales bacterium]|nr:DUF3078 domain-containing protein [Bacteroidales bacterium]
MRKTIHKFLILFFFVVSCLSGFSQEQSLTTKNPGAVIDSLRKAGLKIGRPECPQITLSKDQAIHYLQQRTRPSYWVNQDDPLKKAIDHLLLEASSERFDSIDSYLRKYPYDSIDLSWDRFYTLKPLKVRIPVSGPAGDSTVSFISVKDTLLTAGDTLALKPFASIDTVNSGFAAYRDTTILIVIDTLESVKPDRADFPFRYYNYPYQSDSIRVAVNSLLEYVQNRDSVIVNFSGAGARSVPVWMNSRLNGSMRRYWLKNEYNDSVTVWIGNEGRNTFGLYLEQGVNFRKPMKQADYSEAKINLQKVDKSTLKKQNILIKKRYWNYRTEASMVFSQSALSNWVKGGENSISTALDITGYADFKKPEIKLSSSNFARLKLGFLASGNEDIRKNLDLLETNSKVNHKAFGKFDFSAIMLFKTQVAVGKTYKKVNDEEIATIVSRFMNPATLTIGFGLDYKPDKKTSINFSPISYKGTFVPQGGKITADSLLPGKIDQTRYGIEPGKKSKHEPGASFMLSKESQLLKNMTVTNRLQLFTNYINKPQNIDVDWEMIVVYNLNWFTDLRLNTHLIFDDDTKTTVLKSGVPVLLEDGTEKKTARVQFKELFGVSLMFKF